MIGYRINLDTLCLLLTRLKDEIDDGVMLPVDIAMSEVEAGRAMLWLAVQVKDERKLPLTDFLTLADMACLNDRFREYAINGTDAESYNNGLLCYIVWLGRMIANQEWVTNTDSF